MRQTKALLVRHRDIGVTVHEQERRCVRMRVRHGTRGDRLFATLGQRTTEQTRFARVGLGMHLSAYLRGVLVEGHQVARREPGDHTAHRRSGSVSLVEGGQRGQVCSGGLTPEEDATLVDARAAASAANHWSADRTSSSGAGKIASPLNR